ncbi:MAG: alpha/beta fold hydrolase [Egibacteraceae bacterium]
MHVETHGPAGATDLVLLHGGIGAGRFHWSRLVEPLAERYHLHLPDLPGHGRTPLPRDGRYDRGVLVDALRELLDELGRPAHVAGFSMGGHTALALAQDEPDAFASLALIGVSVREHEALDGWRERFDPDVLSSSYPLLARALAKLHEPLGGSDAWRDVLRRDSGGMEVEVDLQRLADLDCPVLLIRGDRDPACDPAQYAELRQLWGETSEELVVPNGGHDVQLTRHELVGLALLDFLERATDQ